MVDKVFGIDFTDETNPTGDMTISVHNGTTLVDVALSDLVKAIPNLRVITTTAPTVNDDENDGYELGDMWLDTNTARVYMIWQKTAGNAGWRQLDNNVQDILASISSVQGVILYRDASAWVALSPGTAGQVLQTGGAGANPSWATSASADGGYGSRGLTGINNTTTPNTQYDFAADAVVLRNPSGGAVVRTNTGTVTNNVSTAGPAANGRDQAGAFSANSWIHFYFIWNGTTLATLSSAAAPPTGPTLPTGYTHWAYLGAIRFNGSSQLVKTYIRGNKALYENASGKNDLLSAGTATTETSISLASVIPPNALTAIICLAAIFASGTVNDRSDLTLRVTSGVIFDRHFCRLQVGGASALFGEKITEMPNVSQNIYYQWVDQVVSGSPTRQGFISSMGYVMPNGG